jgi:hypothetical protein
LAWSRPDAPASRALRAVLRSLRRHVARQAGAPAAPRRRAVA